MRPIARRHWSAIGVMVGAGLGAPLTVHGQAAPAELDLWALPLENRADLGDIIGRNLPEALLTRDGRLRVRGAGPDDQLTFIDGFRLDRLARVPLAALGRVQVSSAGLPAALADAPGAAIGLRTREIGDRLRLGLELTGSSKRDPDGLAGTPGRQGQALEGFVSGPLVPGRLRQLLAWRLERATLPGGADLQGILSPARGIESQAASGMMKLDLQVHGDHLLSLLTSVDASRAGGTLRLGVSDGALPVFDAGGLLLGLRWLGQLPAGFSVSSNASLQRSWWNESSALCLVRNVDCRRVEALVASTPLPMVLSNSTIHRLRQETSVDLAASIRWVRQAGPGWGHRVKLSSRLRMRGSFEGQSIPGDGFIEYSSGIPTVRTDQFLNDPRVDPGRRGWSLFPGQSLTSLHALEDEISLGGRVTVVPGLAFITTRARSAATSLSDSALAPHLMARWMPARPHGLAIQASSGWRFGDDLEEHARLAAGRPYIRRCLVNPSSGFFDRDCSMTGGPATSEHPGAEELPRTWEGVLSLEQTLGRFALRAEHVERHSGRLDDVEGITSQAFVGPQELLGAASSPRPLLVGRVGSSASRRYRGTTFGGSGRVAGASFSLAYTRASLRDDQGRDASADRRHAFRALAHYRWKAVSLGFVIRADSGLPYSRLFRDEVTGAFVRKAPVGRDPAANLNDPDDDRDLMLDWSAQINLQARFNLLHQRGRRLEVFLDVLNLFDSQAVAEVGERNGVDFATTTRLQEGRWARLGLAYRH